ncbi:NADH-ubiquinone oxidoreductase 20.8 kDa subunit [Ilyonectria robusta]
MASRRAQFNQQLLIDTTPLPENIPAVKEIGASSAPLLSASFFIGARCRDYNDDFMQCKTENPGRGEFECLKEGRRVTRCASSVIQDINTHCLAEFRKHWECLDDRNHQLWQCRPAEWKLNKCVFDNLVRHHPIPPGLAWNPPGLTLSGRNSRRRSPTSPRTSPPLSCDRRRFSPMCALDLVTASPSSLGRARRSNKEQGTTEDRDRSCTFANESKRVDCQSLKPNKHSITIGSVKHLPEKLNVWRGSKLDFRILMITGILVRRGCIIQAALSCD